MSSPAQLQCLAGLMEKVLLLPVVVLVRVAQRETLRPGLSG
ncbi:MULTISPECIES: hypothetical protein [Streptomyces]